MVIKGYRSAYSYFEFERRCLWQHKVGASLRSDLVVCVKRPLRGNYRSSPLRWGGACIAVRRIYSWKMIMMMMMYSPILSVRSYFIIIHVWFESVKICPAVLNGTSRCVTSATCPMHIVPRVQIFTDSDGMPCQIAVRRWDVKLARSWRSELTRSCK